MDRTGHSQNEVNAKLEKVLNARIVLREANWVK